MTEICDESATEALRASVNAAIGVDIRAALQMQNLGGVLDAAAATNVRLIKSVPQQYFERIATQVLVSVQQGQRYSAIVESIQHETGVTEILDAHGAYTNPRFFAQLGKDVESMKHAGQRALALKYGD